MQPRKQQGILQFVTTNNFSFQKRTTLKVDMKQGPTFKFTTIYKKEYVQVCWQYHDELKTEKRAFVKQYVEKCLALGFTTAPCSEQLPALMFSMLPIYLKWCNKTFHTCSSLSFKARACKGWV